MSLEDISPLVWGNYTLDHKSSFYGHYSFLKKFGVSTFQGIIDLFVHPYVTFRKIDRDDCFHHSEVLKNDYNLLAYSQLLILLLLFAANCLWRCMEQL